MKLGVPALKIDGYKSANIFFSLSAPDFFRDARSEKNVQLIRSDRSQLSQWLLESGEDCFVDGLIISNSKTK